MTDQVEITQERGRFRTRDIEFIAGSYENLVKRIPEFEFAPFRVAENLPSNTLLQTVVRKPLSAAENPMPVGVVSMSYALVQHREAANVCVESLREAELKVDDLRCELGLTPLGEYMVFRIYLPDEHGFTAKDGFPTSLRVELINSVNGSHRLVLFFSWLRLACLNGMMIRETKTEVRELHNDRLDLSKVSRGIWGGMKVAAEDIKRLKEWEDSNVDFDKFRAWVDTDLSKAWGKKAASRVYHIALQGIDTELSDPFEAGEATEKAVRFVAEVPGAIAPAQNFYGLLQALTWVATRRNDVEERLAWQTQVPTLMKALRKKAQAVRSWERSW